MTTDSVPRGPSRGHLYVGTGLRVGGKSHSLPELEFVAWSEIEVEFGDQRITAQITEPHDPPARGDEHDRVKREGESLVKDFKRLRLGEFDLSAGRGLLKLSATKIPGSQVMEVRGLLMTLR